MCEVYTYIFTKHCTYFVSLSIITRYYVVFVLMYSSGGPIINLHVYELKSRVFRILVGSKKYISEQNYLICNLCVSPHTKTFAMTQPSHVKYGSV